MLVPSAKTLETFSTSPDYRSETTAEMVLIVEEREGDMHELAP